MDAPPAEPQGKPPSQERQAQASLFGEAAEPRVGSGLFAAVALERSIDKLLDYEVPPGLVKQVKVGQRVRVPLGRRDRGVLGYVVRLSDASTHARTKRLLSIADERALVSGKLLELALWIGRYYVCPLGVVLESIIPSAVKKRIGLGYSQIVYPALGPGQLQAVLEATRAKKRRSVIGRLLQIPAGEGVEIVRLAGESGVKPATLRGLVKLGLVEIRSVADYTSPVEPQPDGLEAPLEMNVDQQKALTGLEPRLAEGFSVNLLHGVTGSGKTEVYLQAIKQVIDAGRQAIVLVPEIALTPQTARRFTRRFGNVAVLHSGLTATQRHRYWQQIANGEADVVVGARSGVFAPLPRLGVIVVDEEHESSYKQDQAPRYHARDVAIMRASLEGCCVILGSATPALESYHAAKGGERGEGSKPNWHYLELPARILNRAMAHVERVDMKLDRQVRNQRRMAGVHLFSLHLEDLLRRTLNDGQQAILLLNRRGYANFIHCPRCGEVVQCKYCDTTLTYHRTAGQAVGHAAFEAGQHAGDLHCHYCLAVNPVPTTCPACNHDRLSLFGLGTQRVEEELARKFPNVPFERVDSDTMRNSRDYEQTLTRFASGELKVLIGTQMIAKGLDFPNVTLVGVISGDTSLSLPDFRSAERTFGLITQVAGRAGRGDKPGRVLVQTFIPDDPSITFALKQDFAGFAAGELASRREVGHPPFARMVRVVMRDEDLDKLLPRAEQLAAKFATEAASVGGVTVQGPVPCAVARVSGFHRYQLLLRSTSPGRLQAVLARLRKVGALATADRVAVDVDPVSLL